MCQGLKSIYNADHGDIALRAAPALLPLPAHVRIAIVGSGFSGLGSAIALSNEGYGDD